MNALLAVLDSTHTLVMSIPFVGTAIKLAADVGEALIFPDLPLVSHSRGLSSFIFCVCEAVLKLQPEHSQTIQSHYHITDVLDSAPGRDTHDCLSGPR